MADVDNSWLAPSGEPSEGQHKQHYRQHYNKDYSEHDQVPREVKSAGLTRRATEHRPQLIQRSATQVEFVEEHTLTGSLASSSNTAPASKAGISEQSVYSQLPDVHKHRSEDNAEIRQSSSSSISSSLMSESKHKRHHKRKKSKHKYDRKDRRSSSEKEYPLETDSNIEERFIHRYSPYHSKHNHTLEGDDTSSEKINPIDANTVIEEKTRKQHKSIQPTEPYRSITASTIFGHVSDHISQVNIMDNVQKDHLYMSSLNGRADVYNEVDNKMSITRSDVSTSEAFIIKDIQSFIPEMEKLENRVKQNINKVNGERLKEMLVRLGEHLSAMTGIAHSLHSDKFSNGDQVKDKNDGFEKGDSHERQHGRVQDDERIQNAEQWPDPEDLTDNSDGIIKAKIKESRKKLKKRSKHKDKNEDCKGEDDDIARQSRDMDVLEVHTYLPVRAREIIKITDTFWDGKAKLLYNKQRLEELDSHAIKVSCIIQYI